MNIKACNGSNKFWPRIQRFYLFEREEIALILKNSKGPQTILIRLFHLCYLDWMNFVFNRNIILNIDIQREAWTMNRALS